MNKADFSLYEAVNYQLVQATFQIYSGSAFDATKGPFGQRIALRQGKARFIVCL